MLSLSLRENIKLKSDCMNLCKSENDAEMAKYIFDITEEDNASIQYTSILYQILYDDFDDICMNYDGFVDFVASFQEKNVLLMNALLHYIHMNFPYAREEGIQNVAQIRHWEHKEKTCIEHTFFDLHVGLHDFPEDLKEKIEKAFSHIKDDVSIVYTTTWTYCHLDMGNDYMYKDNESPRIEIYFPEEVEGKYIQKILKEEF